MGQIIISEIGNPSCTQVISFQDIGARGIPGESAYQYAIRTGMFVGTQEQFYNHVITEPINAAVAANQAAQNANEAAGNVNDAVATALESAENADLAAQNANQAAADTILATDQAILATQDAVQAATNATAATDSATQAANSANSAASNANTAKDATILATEAANAAKDSANTAASGANAAKNLANDAAILASNKATEANAAAISANSAAAGAAQFQNKQSLFFSPKQLLAWDNFDRADVNPIVKAESGQNYAAWKGTNVGQITGKLYASNSPQLFQESAALLTITPTKNIGIEFAMQRSTVGHSAVGVAIVKDTLNYIFFGRVSISAANTIFPEIAVSGNHQLISVVNGVATVLGSFARDSIYSGGNNDPFQDSRMTFVFRYLNRGRANSGILVQSLDKPDQRIDVDVTNLNSIYALPNDYNRIAIIGSNAVKIMSYNVADLNL